MPIVLRSSHGANVMSGTERRGAFYSVPAEIAHSFTPEQFGEYVFGRQSDAHVRRWFAEQRLRATDGITTESLLAAIRPVSKREAA
jgi:hypothetical protein